jgi:1-phosphatidylinositol-4-phosphate 5-kinase
MGRSGSFFFFSNDKKLLVKSMKQDDVDAWNKSFKQYALHVKTNPESLLARIYGVYSIEMEGTSVVHVLLMKNCT